MVTASWLRSGNGNALGVAFDEGDRIVQPALRGARASDCEHLRIDVDNGRARARAARLHHAEGDIARAAGEVEQGKRPRVGRGIGIGRRPVPGRIDGGDERVFQARAARPT